MGMIMLSSFLPPFVDQLNDRLGLADCVLVAPLPNVRTLRPTVQQLETEIATYRRRLAELQNADAAYSVGDHIIERNHMSHVRVQLVGSEQPKTISLVVSFDPPRPGDRLN
jgi:capsule polysaccharide export protein KpsE/RkpR